ncbi:hypothetical protein J1605_019593 [Eschrichtius robustus]|uniref:Uncharacterized protein n=1 Tax=Eschrichtius robustus TaxID=9764 RepID=A0AB34HNI0_ESCRO|nr:hypothetical protein J1605_019593 [Eschrichtius robustus]
MEGARPPSPGDELELSVIQGQPDEQAPLNGAVQGIFALEEEPCPVQPALWAQQTPSAGGARWNILNGADTTMPSTLSLLEGPRIPPAPRNLRNLIREVCGSSLQRQNPQS